MLMSLLVARFLSLWVTFDKCVLSYAMVVMWKLSLLPFEALIYDHPSNYIK